MGLSGDMNYGLFMRAKQQQARPQQNAPQENNDLDAIQAWLKQRPRPTEEAPSQPQAPQPRFELLAEAKQAPKAPAFDPSAISPEEIEKAGGLRPYVQKASGVELFRGNYDNASALVSYLIEQEGIKEPREQRPPQRGFQASRNSVAEKIGQGDYYGALGDIDRMKAMNDMFARAINTVQQEIQNNATQSFKYFQ